MSVLEQLEIRLACGKVALVSPSRARLVLRGEPFFIAEPQRRGVGAPCAPYAPEDRE